LCKLDGALGVIPAARNGQSRWAVLVPGQWQPLLMVLAAALHQVMFALPVVQAVAGCC